MLSFLLRGGVVMLPIAALSVVTVALIVERAIVLAAHRSPPGDLGAEVVERLVTGGRSGLLADLESRSAPEARVLAAGIRPVDLGASERESLMELEAMRILSVLETRVSWLQSIANVATLLGLLGTVTGMIGAFARVQAAGVTNPTVLSGGISEALITTAAGLVVAIPALVAYHLIANSVSATATRMEIAATRLLAHLADRAGSARVPRSSATVRAAAAAPTHKPRGQGG